ncbi:hypothetical protein USDA257_c01910 [Sinorhizobium fredii USDA 257]|uniref:Uncharacterized protein n=1 Tax=Sinorhizobium fredii (strain USDA 257) TaxID=1185652 RepID=I3WYT5_SINF2|nr:hypothetical protein USDA257_c01910 [Sinorhizobium fredii USDA 257]
MVTWGSHVPTGHASETEPRPPAPRVNILESIAFRGLPSFAPSGRRR